METIANIMLMVFSTFMLFEMIRLHIMLTKFDKKLTEAKNLNDMYNLFYEE